MSKPDGAAANYDYGWFQQRAFESLKPISEGVWDYSYSLLGYTPGNEVEYELLQQAGTPYEQLVTTPEEDYLESIAGAVAEQLPPEFEYIDLGPGTEHKEQLLFDALKRLGKKFVYRPVDVNAAFLGRAADHASEQGIHVDPVRSSFEGLADALGNTTSKRFVSLGLTYSNYRPEVILGMLASIAGTDGSFFVNAQMRDRVHMAQVVEVYTDDIRATCEPKLRLLGLDFATDVAEHYCDDGIRTWNVLGNSTERLERLGIRSGAKLLVFQSLRPTVETFHADVSAVSRAPVFFDTGSTFMGALLS